ncbi:MAG: hypothetical protein EXR81_05615 [Gammaproteobacteria bacterium]|nr:hypothetical protein [Gammaproteobacteria bacterium]
MDALSVQPSEPSVEYGYHIPSFRLISHWRRVRLENKFYLCTIFINNNIRSSLMSYSLGNIEALRQRERGMPLSRGSALSAGTIKDIIEFKAPAELDAPAFQGFFILTQGGYLRFIEIDQESPDFSFPAQRELRVRASPLVVQNGCTPFEEIGAMIQIDVITLRSIERRSSRLYVLTAKGALYILFIKKISNEIQIQGVFLLSLEGTDLENKSIISLIPSSYPGVKFFLTACGEVWHRDFNDHKVTFIRLSIAEPVRQIFDCDLPLLVTDTGIIQVDRSQSYDGFATQEKLKQEKIPGFESGIIQIIRYVFRGSTVLLLTRKGEIGVWNYHLPDSFKRLLLTYPRPDSPRYTDSERTTFIYSRIYHTETKIIGGYFFITNLGRCWFGKAPPENIDPSEEIQLQLVNFSQFNRSDFYLKKMITLKYHVKMDFALFLSRDNQLYATVNSTILNPFDLMLESLRNFETPLNVEKDKIQDVFFSGESLDIFDNFGKIWRGICVRASLNVAPFSKIDFSAEKQVKISGLSFAQQDTITKIIRASEKSNYLLALGQSGVAYQTDRSVEHVLDGRQPDIHLKIIAGISSKIIEIACLKEMFFLLTDDGRILFRRLIRLNDYTRLALFNNLRALKIRAKHEQLCVLAQNVGGTVILLYRYELGELRLYKQFSVSILSKITDLTFNTAGAGMLLEENGKILVWTAERPCYLLDTSAIPADDHVISLTMNQRLRIFLTEKGKCWVSNPQKDTPEGQMKLEVINLDQLDHVEFHCAVTKAVLSASDDTDTRGYLIVNDLLLFSIPDWFVYMSQPLIRLGGRSCQ